MGERRMVRQRKEHGRSARSAGSDSPIIYGFIPRVSAEDLRRWIIEAAAAEQTIESKSVPATPEGAEAKRSMESRLALAVRNRDNLVRDIVGSAKVFQGGGTEMLQLTLEREVEGCRHVLTRALVPSIRRSGFGCLESWDAEGSRGGRPAVRPLSPIPAQRNSIRSVRRCSRVLAWERPGQLSGRSLKPSHLAGRVMQSMLR